MVESVVSFASVAFFRLGSYTTVWAFISVSIFYKNNCCGSGLYLKAKLIMFWKGLGANLTTQNKEFKMFTLKSLNTKYKQLT